MYKLLVFDLDGTLAKVGKGIEEETLALLKRLEKDGYQVAICSGKTTFYLSGFMRQIGLENPVLIGENGANIQFGIELPPKRFFLYPYSQEAGVQMKKIGKEIEALVGKDIWHQPNIVGLTVFPKDEETFEKIAALVETRRAELKDVIVYRHVDSFDITPKEINKYNGLKYLSELTGIKAEEMLAVGDGVNDIPMFEYAGFSIGIGDGLKEHTDICFDSIIEALRYIEKRKATSI